MLNNRINRVSFIVAFLLINLTIVSGFCENVSNRNERLNPKSDSLINLSRKYLSRSQPDKSISVLFRLIHIDSLSNDKLDLCKILLAESYRQKLEFNKAIELVSTLLKSEYLSNYNRAFAYNRMAAFFDEGDTIGRGSRYDSVIYYSNLSIKISRKYRYNKLLYLSYNELGFAYMSLNDTAKSREYIELAFQGFKDINDIPNTMNTAINMSRTYLNLGKLDKAQSIINDVLKIDNSKVNKNLLMRLYLYLSKINDTKGDYKQAFITLKKAREMQHDYFFDRMNEQINEMSALYDLQQKEAQIKKAQQQAQIERQQKYILIIAVLGLIVLTIVMFFSFQFRRKFLKQKRELIKSENDNLKKDLEFKNKELVTNALSMAKQMECNIDISEKLRAIMPHGNEKVKKDLMQTIKAMNANQSTKAWKEFEVHFSNVHEEFYKKLRTNYPDLTPTELKTCAFLKLNMNTKDIAALTNRSPRTIENSRLSIRKKLGIDTDINLVSFLIDL